MLLSPPPPSPSEITKLDTQPVIDVRGLTHRYGKRVIYENLSFSVSPGKIAALLGRNGVGKTTLIRILMGFLKPVGGTARVLGEDAHTLSAATRARIGLLFEGHLAYDFMTIEQIERFYRPFFPRWRRDLYYDLVGRLGLPPTHRIANMSCGQRSQVVLGLIFAQSPDLMILDDYSMGIDVGYRRLFLDYLRNYLAEGGKSVFMTSHVIQDMEKLVDEVIFLQRGGRILQMPLADFMRRFQCYRFTVDDDIEQARQALLADVAIEAVDILGTAPLLYAFDERDGLTGHLAVHHPRVRLGDTVPMTLEDAFVGLTGKY